MKTISPDLLRRLFKYEPESGRLYWRERDSSWFAGGKYSPERMAAIWNGRFAGKEALTATMAIGYKTGNVLSKDMLAHRVIWALVHDEQPPEIDHINGNRSDNRLSNLRASERLSNSKSQKRRDDNRSGVTGVSWDKRHNQWFARIKVNYRTIYLGSFSDINSAAKARKEAEKLYGFHPNHGRTMQSRSAA